MGWGNNYVVLNPVPNLYVFCSTQTEEEAWGPQDFTHQYRVHSFPSSSEYRRAASLCVSNKVLYLLFSQQEPDRFVKCHTHIQPSNPTLTHCQHNCAVQATVTLPQLLECFGWLEDRVALCGGSARWHLGDNVQVST